MSVKNKDRRTMSQEDSFFQKPLKERVRAYLLGHCARAIKGVSLLLGEEFVRKCHGIEFRLLLDDVYSGVNKRFGSEPKGHSTIENLHAFLQNLGSDIISCSVGDVTVPISAAKHDKSLFCVISNSTSAANMCEVSISARNCSDDINVYLHVDLADVIKGWCEMSSIYATLTDEMTTCFEKARRSLNDIDTIKATEHYLRNIARTQIFYDGITTIDDLVDSFISSMTSLLSLSTPGGATSEWFAQR